MCGRYTLTTTSQLLVDRFGGDLPPREAVGRYNVAPTEAMAVVTELRDGVRRTEAARWGLLPGWARDLRARPAPINVRSEDALDKRAFARLLGRDDGDHGRCLVLADGWYEWLRAEDRRRGESGPPTPFRYTVDDGGPFAFAALTALRRIGDERVRCAAILTTRANAVCAPVHDRMPVVLAGPDEEAAWLSAAVDAPAALRLCELLAAARTSVAPVSARVNKAGLDDEGPWLLEPDPPPPEPAQGALF